MISRIKRAFSGLYIDREGYKRFRNSRRLFHRYVAKRMIGRDLEEGEVVHHRDGNKMNNKRSNLQICTRRQHWWIHHRNNRYRRRRRYYNDDIW